MNEMKKPRTFIKDSITIECTFSKMQKCSVAFAWDAGEFLSQNFESFFLSLQSYEALPECKNPYWCTSSITSVICCPLTMVLTCLSVSLHVGMQNRRRRANDGMVRNCVVWSFQQYYLTEYFVPFKQTSVTVIILERMFCKNHFMTSFSSDNFLNDLWVDMDFGPW